MATTGSGTQADPFRIELDITISNLHSRAGDTIYVLEGTSIGIDGGNFQLYNKNGDVSGLRPNEISSTTTSISISGTLYGSAGSYYQYNYAYMEPLNYNPKTGILTIVVVGYTVYWKNGSTLLETDTGVRYGTTPTYNSATPTKAQDAAYTYSFSGWSPSLAPINSSASQTLTYTAQFTGTIRKYTVTWKNYDNSVIKTDTDIRYGTAPTYTGPTPIKPNTAQYTYTFTGWNPSTSTGITGDTVYTAQYSATVNNYTVTWVNYDDAVIEVDTDIPYGTTPTYDSLPPTRANTAQYTYTFTGWSPTVSSVTGDVTYVAQFSATVNEYTITWRDWDLTLLETDTGVPYGTTPTYDGTLPSRSGYSFAGWSPEVIPVVGDKIYTADYTLDSEMVRGTVGANAFWELNFVLKTLRIYGEGTTYDYTGSDTPWYTYASSIESIQVDDGITRIGNYLFSDLTNLKSIDFGGTLAEIGDHVLSGNDKVASLDIPNTVTAIGDYAFTGLSALESINFWGDIQTLGEGAFSECPAVKSIMMTGSEPPTMDTNAFNLGTSTNDCDAMMYTSGWGNNTIFSSAVRGEHTTFNYLTIPLEPYHKLMYNGSKIQVESAIRDGEGVKFSTNYVKKSEIISLGPHITGKIDLVNMAILSSTAENWFMETYSSENGLSTIIVQRATSIADPSNVCVRTSSDNGDTWTNWTYSYAVWKV